MRKNTLRKTVSMALVGAMAVSYTHLDVYKRQRLLRQSGPDGIQKRIFLIG